MDRFWWSAAAGPDAERDDWWDHRHADNTGDLHLHRALHIDDRAHRLSDRHHHGRGRGALANVGVAASAPATIAIGTPFAFTISVSNAGPAAATNVVLQDTLPEGASFVSATTSSGSCTHANGLVRCTLGTLAGGGTATISVTVNPTIAGAHQNSAVVSADQGYLVATNNTAVTTASTPPTVTPCTTVCFSGPTGYIAGDFDLSLEPKKATSTRTATSTWFTGRSTYTIGILLNNGVGGFGPHTTMTIPGSPDGGAVADFDNDDHLDDRRVGRGGRGVAAARQWPRRFRRACHYSAGERLGHRGNRRLQSRRQRRPGARKQRPRRRSSRSGSATGTARSSRRPTFGSTTTNSAVLVDDFNNDGNPDLAAHDDGVGLMIVLGSGVSGFQPPTSIPLLGASGVIKVGDLTGDGFADLIVGIVSPTENVLRLFVGNGGDGSRRQPSMGGERGRRVPGRRRSRQRWRHRSGVAA